MKFYFLTINYLHQFFGFFDISLLQVNYWRHHIKDDMAFFTFNLF